MTIATTKFRFGAEGFPILFEDGRLRVYKNPTNEIIIEDIESNVMMRIKSHNRGEGLEFTAYGRVEPVQVNGMIGWRVSRR